MWLIVAMLALPLIEIALFILVGGVIGLWPTLGLVVATSITGVLILRARGFGTMLEARRSLERGQDPAAALASGALSVLAGLLLLVPGFLTDAIGLALLLPPVRTLIIARMRAGIPASGTASRQDGSGTIIDGTWHEVDDPPRPASPPGPSGWTRH